MEKNLTVACTDAMKVSAERSDGGFLFDTEIKRYLARDTFYHTLESNFDFNTIEEGEDARYYVPCLVLIDWDGYYIGYTETFQNEYFETEYTDVITNKLTWNKECRYQRGGRTGNCVVRFTLNDFIEVTVNKRKYNGMREDVIEKLNEEGIIVNEIMDDNDYSRIKDETIISIINEKVEYYINTHNDMFNQYDADYKFVMPYDGDFEARKLRTPTVLAFMQGFQYSTERGYVNIYGLSASDIIKGKTYYLDEMGLYHEKDCPNRSTIVYSGSIDNCAKKGGNPCSCIQ